MNTTAHGEFSQFLKFTKNSRTKRKTTRKILGKSTVAISKLTGVKHRLNCSFESPPFTYPEVGDAEFADPTRISCDNR